MPLLLATSEALAEGDAERGREVAQTWCARCRVVGTAKLHGRIASTSTFFLMIEKLAEYRQRVLTLKDAGRQGPRSRRDLERRS